MKLIEIAALENGAHRNQEIHTMEFLSDLMEVPEGYAVIPEDMEIPDTFPFVNLKAEMVTRSIDAYIDKEGNRIPEILERMEVVEMTPGGYPLWSPPTGAQDAYKTGDIVSYEEQLWQSKIDGNATPPGSDERWWSRYTEA